MKMHAREIEAANKEIEFLSSSKLDSKRHHPIVGALIPSSTDELIQSIDNQTKDTAFERVTSYTKFGVVAVWSFNKASVGQVSKNLTVCTGNLTVLVDKSLGVWGMLEE